MRSNGSLLPFWNAVFSSGRLMMSRIGSFCQKQTPKQTRNAAEADDQPRAELVEVLDEAQPVVVGDRPQRGAGHAAIRSGAR